MQVPAALLGSAQEGTTTKNEEMENKVNKARPESDNQQVPERLKEAIEKPINGDGAVGTGVVNGRRRLRTLVLGHAEAGVGFAGSRGSWSRVCWVTRKLAMATAGDAVRKQRNYSLTSSVLLAVVGRGLVVVE
ncbi:Uncharacterized protein Fot_03473 [Forsythia ovata]|uniref:Uncharacterized protein n=1 Tax=Forsythia ovata TaxID=205694 RepID=A0ABD1X9T6_9LAMI